jgi:cytochrome P450
LSVAGTPELTDLAREFLSDTERRADRPEILHELQRAPLISVGEQQWLVAGYRNVSAVMRSAGAALSTAFPVAQAPEVNSLFLSLLPYEHGANHQRLRAIGQSVLTRSAVSAVRKEIELLVEQRLLPAALAAGSDIHSGFADAIPGRVSCLLLDVDGGDWGSLAARASVMYAQVGRYDQPEGELAQADAAVAWLRDYVKRRLCDTLPDRGGVGNRLIALCKAKTISEEELVQFFALFLFTGMETLSYAVVNSLWFLGTHPEIFARLRADDSLAEAAFDETMRLCGPIRLCARQLVNDVEIDGGSLPAGSIVFLVLQAANRDRAAIESPDEFQWTRRHSGLLAFGAGPHGCMGAVIGRTVGATVFRTVAKHCSAVWASPDEQPVRLIPSQQIFGIASARFYADAVRGER